jgi:hypothetical protein
MWRVLVLSMGSRIEIGVLREIEYRDGRELGRDRCVHPTTRKVLQEDSRVVKV